MRRVISIVFIGLFFTAVSIFSQQLTDYKICIDPGHGGHGSNDRYMAIAEFWESEGNFYKAQHLEEILTDLGADVILTRYGNRDSDGISLSSRSAIANANNVDYFHSIHSNALNGNSNVNRTLMLFRGYTSSPIFPPSKDMANIMVEHLYKANRTTGKQVSGDWSFYTWWDDPTVGLGVLRNLSMPGTLSEGSFHDYYPETFRLKNDSYLRHEAWAIARSFVDLFNVDKIETGVLGGILRDPDKSVPSSYKPINGTNDNKKAINYVRVRLEPGGQIYEGDAHNNGYYMFDELEPGDYKLYFETDYYERDSAEVTVSAHKSSFVDKMLSEVPDYNAPNIVSNFPDDNTTDFSTRDTLEIWFDQRMDRLTTEQAFNISPSVIGKFIWGELDNKLMFFPQVPFEQNTDYTVIISTAAETVYDSNLEEEFSFGFTTGTAAGSNVVASSPLDGEDEVSNIPSVALIFDTRMNTITTESAFLITPHLSGSFKWSEEYDTLYFNANEPGTPGETYTVTLETSARNYFGGYLLEQYSFSFTTRSKLNLVSAYPEAGDADISTTVLIKLKFDKSINASSLPGNIMFYDSDDNFVSIVVNQSAYSKGIIEFSTQEQLEKNAEYRVILKEGIGDIEDVNFNEDIVIDFTTENITVTPGNIIHDFESESDWQDPFDSEFTKGVDEDFTNFNMSGVKKYSGNSSGKLNYTFIGEDGTVYLELTDPIELGSSASEFGIFVFGDNSHNSLYYLFEDDGSNRVEYLVDTLMWTGWKIKSLNLLDLNIGGNITFAGISVKKETFGDSEGLIYFDDAQTDFAVPVNDEFNSTPKEYTLMQNYPNPFNPSTKIEFALPEVSNVTLEIFNVLGQRVAALINNQSYQAGVWEVNWNGKDDSGSQLPSGMYIYKLSTSKFSSVKKMVLLK